MVSIRYLLRHYHRRRLSYIQAGSPRREEGACRFYLSLSLIEEGFGFWLAL